MIHQDFVGGSGAIYRYLAVNSDRDVPLGAGNFLYVRMFDGRSTILYAGEAERLTAAIHGGWREAVDKHGATNLFARRNVGFIIRAEEQADLVKGHAPVMNPPLEPAAAEAGALADPV